MIRVADYIADFIYQQGVRDVFMLSGGGSIYLDDGIACHGKLNHISVRNESTAPMMAEAYARITGHLGVVYVTTGPGGANAVTGIAEAWVDSAPILVISGQVQRRHTTRNARINGLRTFGVQELDIIEIVDSITKYAVMVNDPDDIRYHLERAVYLAMSGRPGPVWLDIPLDVQAAEIDPDHLRGWKPPETRIDHDGLDKSVDDIFALLRHAERPLIIAGQGVRQAQALGEFVRLVERLDVPVILSRLGQDMMPFSNENNFGHGGYAKGLRYNKLIVQDSDLILVLGSRLAVAFVGEDDDLLSPDTKIIAVDIDEAELARPGRRIDLSVHANLKDVVTRLLVRANNVDLPDWSAWLRTCRDYKRRYPIITNEHKRNPIDLYYFTSRLDALSGPNDIFVSDAGSSYFVTGQTLRFEHGQREVTSGAFASMGLSVPLAIGCSLADKEARVLAVTGDGSLELNIQELKTMSYYRVNVKLFVINNGGYASIRNTQDALFEGRYIGSDQIGRNEMLDFRKIADAFDLPYAKIDRYEEMDDNIREIIERPGPVFVEVVCQSNQKIVEPLEGDRDEVFVNQSSHS
ncbi:MAG: thiamine pyrophosphate-binding protein [Sedimentisphaerales bacterium]|nr:thiamine pyrophosphate-binding protein [Sedimentisphaerales bacterium]